jgi:hypothetical protein
MLMCLQSSCQPHECADSDGPRFTQAGSRPRCICADYQLIRLQSSCQSHEFADSDPLIGEPGSGFYSALIMITIMIVIMIIIMIIIMIYNYSAIITARGYWYHGLRGHDSAARPHGLR